VIKTALITLVALVVAVGIAIAGYSMFGARDEPSAPTPQSAANDNVNDGWDGTGSRPVNATFVRSGQTITVQRVDYRTLNTTEADAEVVIAVPAKSSRLPAWITRTAFSARSTDARTFRPAVSASRDGQFFYVSVRFRDLPTDYLGPTCDNANGPINTLEMTIKGPDGQFAVGLVAPNAPAGGCLAAEQARHPAPKPKKARKCRRGSRKAQAKCRAKQKQKVSRR
jgi:hypothetical protein